MLRALQVFELARVPNLVVLELARSSPAVRVTTKKARERVFDFVAKFVTAVIKDRVAPYAWDIQAACLNSVWIETEQAVRAAAFRPLIALLDVLPQRSMDQHVNVRTPLTTPGSRRAHQADMLYTIPPSHLRAVLSSTTHIKC